MATLPGFKERVRLRRAQLCWSQEHLARLSNVSKNTVARWEAGGVPRGETLTRLAAALGVTTDWLTKGEGPEPEPLAATGTDG